MDPLLTQLTKSQRKAFVTSQSKFKLTANAVATNADLVRDDSIVKESAHPLAPTEARKIDASVRAVSVFDTLAERERQNQIDTLTQVLGGKDKFEVFLNRFVDQHSKWHVDSSEHENDPDRATEAPERKKKHRKHKSGKSSSSQARPKPHTRHPTPYDK